MGIDIGVAESGAEAPEEMERICSVPGFFSMAEALSKLLDIMDANDIPYNLGNEELEPLAQIFKGFCADDTEIYEERFTNYCDFICAAHEAVEEEHGATKDVFTGQPLIKPRPEEFRQDVRALLGRGILVSDPIPPDEAGELASLLLFARAVLARFTGHFRVAQPEAARKLEGIQEILATATEYLLKGEGEGKTVFISY